MDAVVIVPDRDDITLTWRDMAVADPGSLALDGTYHGPFHVARVRKLLDMSVLGDISALIVACSFCGAPVNARCDGL